MDHARPPSPRLRVALAYLHVAVRASDPGADVRMEQAALAALEVIEWDALELARGHDQRLLFCSPLMAPGWALCDGNGCALVAQVNLPHLLDGFQSARRVKRVAGLPAGCWRLEPLLMPDLEADLDGVDELAELEALWAEQDAAVQEDGEG